VPSDDGVLEMRLLHESHHIANRLGHSLLFDHLQASSPFIER
jgi:hypothetical protein